MATLTTQVVNLTSGLVPSMGSAAADDKVRPGPTTFLMVSNGSGGSINVTIAVPGTTKYGQANPSIVIAVANGATKLIGPLTKLVQGTDKLVDVDYSATSSVTRAAIRV
jgi:hypothetical protein